MDHFYLVRKCKGLVIGHDGVVAELQADWIADLPVNLIDHGMWMPFPPLPPVILKTIFAYTFLAVYYLVMYVSMILRVSMYDCMLCICAPFHD